MKAGYSTPMLHVADVEHSIRFYQLLGFKLIDIEGADWARMHTEDGSAIMLLRGESEHRVKPEEQGIMLVLYTQGLAELREHLIAAGEKPKSIEHPTWMPSGTFMLRDPDGYGVGINQWGDAEHSAWLEKLKRKHAAGILPNEQK